MSLRLITRSVWMNPGNRKKRIMKTLDALRWQVSKRRTGASRRINLANGAQFIAHPDCVVSSALMYADWPEYFELQFIRKHLAPSDSIIDVGAYVGHVSLLLSDLVTPPNVFAFEPSPLAYRRLKENWQANEWETERLFNMAVGALTGKAWISQSEQPKTTAQVASSPSPEAALEIPMCRLDDFMGFWTTRTVGLLKIDVEGGEADVFRGSSKLLQETPPRIIMFENLGASVNNEVAGILNTHGFMIFQLDSAGHPDAGVLEAQNLFAVPERARAAYGL